MYTTFPTWTAFSFPQTKPKKNVSDSNTQKHKTKRTQRLLNIDRVSALVNAKHDKRKKKKN